MLRAVWRHKSHAKHLWLFQLRFLSGWPRKIETKLQIAMLFIIKMQEMVHKICQHYKNRSVVQRGFTTLGWIKVIGMLYEYTDLRWVVRIIRQQGRGLFVHHVPHSICRPKFVHWTPERLSAAVPPWLSDFQQQICEDPINIDRSSLFPDPSGSPIDWTLIQGR